MITTHYIPPDAKVCKTIYGNRRIVKLPHLTWDDSTTPPPRLTQRYRWKVVQSGGVMHPFFILEDTLWSVASTTTQCQPQKVFSK
jgi:hypothetical protein